MSLVLGHLDVCYIKFLIIFEYICRCFIYVLCFVFIHKIHPLVSMCMCVIYREKVNETKVEGRLLSCSATNETAVSITRLRLRHCLYD